MRKSNANSEWEKTMKSFTLVGLDPGPNIGVACLTERGCNTFVTKHTIDLAMIEFDYIGIEDFVPYHGAPMTRDVIDLIKLIGQLEYMFPQRILICRSKANATIVGKGNAKKALVNKALRDLGIISPGMSQHEVDALVIALTLGITLEQRGHIVPNTFTWLKTFRAIARCRS